MRVINGYMTRYKVNFEIQSRVRKYIEYTLKNESNSEQENLILNKLNKSLKKELMMESMGKFIKEIPFFKDNFCSETIEKIVFSLKKVQLNPEDFLFNVLIIL